MGEPLGGSSTPTRLLAGIENDSGDTGRSSRAVVIRGRPRIDTEIRRLIRLMAQDGWGAPRIHAELTKLGFIISEKTVSRYMPRLPAEPDQVKRWVAFLHHKDDIAAMDLFTVPTASLRLLYGFFVIEHGRRHIVHFNATFHPTSAWVMQQLREAFPYDTAPRYLVLDRDSIFSPAVVEFHKGHAHKACSHLLSQSLAKRNRGTLDRELPPRDARTRRHPQRTASRPARAFVHQLLPRGPLPLGSRQSHSGRETGHATTVTRDRSRHDRHPRRR